MIELSQKSTLKELSQNSQISQNNSMFLNTPWVKEKREKKGEIRK